MKKEIKVLGNRTPGKTALSLHKFSTSLHLIVLITLPVLVYYHTLGFDYTYFDDVEMIKNNTQVLGKISNIKIALQSDAFFRKPPTNFYRPVQTISLILDGTIGSSKFWMYHLTNLLLHILVSLSVYFLLLSLLIPKSISFFCALLFSIHPLFASVVSWIPARGDLLIALEGIWLFLSFSKHISTGRIKYFWLHLLIFFLLIFTKETGIIFPFFLLLYSWFILKKEASFKRLLPYIIGWSIVIILNLVVRNYVLTGKKSEETFGLVSFLKNLPAIPIAFGKFFIPQNLTTLALFDVPSLIIGIILLTLFVTVIIKSFKSKAWIVVIGFAWFLLFTLPPLFTRVNVFADNYFQYLEHRAYLPSIGIIILIAALLKSNTHKYSARLVNIAAAVCVLLFSAIAYAHSNDYKDAIAFNTAAIESSPNKNAYAYSNRGVAYFNEGNYTDAIADFETSVNILGNYVMYYNKGYTEMMAGNNDAAEKDITEAISLKPDLINFYINRCIVYDRLGKFDKALADINKAEKMDDKNDIVYCRKGDVLFHLNLAEEAIENYSKSIDLNPEAFEAFNKRARTYYHLKKYELAIEDSKKLLALNVENDVAYSNLGVISLDLGKYNDAIDWFTKAINTDNSLGGVVYFNRGRAALKINKQADACSDFRKAFQLGFTAAKDSSNKYCK